MTDSASFELRLLDKVSRTSKKITGSVEGMLGSLGRTGRVAESADKMTRRALGRTVRATRKADKAIEKSSRFRDKKGRLREKDSRFVGGGGKSIFGGGSGGGGIGGIGDLVKADLITRAIAGLARLAITVAQGAGEFIAFKQNSDLAFNQLTKHDIPGGKLFEHASQLARRFGLDVFDTTKQYQKFLALQFNPTQIDKLTKMGADLRVLGNDAEAVQGIFTAIGQIKSKNKLQAEEMMQLAERGVSGALITEEVGKLLGGKSADQVRSLQQKGKIDATIGLKAIENAIKRKLGESELGEAGAKFADTTITGFLGRIKAFGQDAGLTLVEKLIAPLTRVAGTAMTRLGTFIGSAEGAATIERMADGLGRFAEQAIELGSVFGTEFGGGFSKIWTELAAGGAAFSDAFGGGDITSQVGQLATALGEISALAVGFGVAFAGVSVAMVAFGERAWEVGKAVASGLVEPLFSRIAGVMLWWDEISGIWNAKGMGVIEKSWELGKEIVSGIGRGIWSLATWLPEQMLSVVTTAYDAAKKALGIHSPSKVFAELGKYTTMGFAVGIESGASDVMTSTRGMADDAMYGPTMASIGAPADVGGGLSFGGGSIHVEMPIEVHGGGDAEETAEMVRREVRREIESFFREMALEHG